MSFSGDVKEELSRYISSARHCQIAELAALLGMCGSIAINSRNQYSIKIHTENFSVARKVFTLIEKTFNIEADIAVRRNMTTGSISCTILVKKHEEAWKILQATRLIDERRDGFEEVRVVNPLIVQQPCCKRAFLRGVFLAAGSMSAPEKAYHFEIVCAAKVMAEQVREIICGFSMDAKIVPRKKVYVVYLKEGAQIVDILNVMEAHRSLLELENVRIVKEVRNEVNRKVNCETANLKKVVSASVAQIEDITYLRDTVGLHTLSEGLEEVALARLSNPDASLKELGEMLSPPVGKSGVNHRLRRIGELAEKVRQERGGLL